MTLRLHKLVMAAAICSVSLTFAAAQTPNELTARYGKPKVMADSLKAYRVRPGVRLVPVADCGAAGRTRQMVVAPELNGSIVYRGEVLMRRAAVEEIVNELLPENKRGRKINASTTYSSCLAVEIQEYERVSVVMHWACNVKGKRGISHAVISWKCS